MKFKVLGIFMMLVVSVSNAWSAESVPVTVKEGETSYQGDLYYPKGAKGSLPLVVVIHEWWGKSDYPKMRANKIADELGFAALAVDMYGDAKAVETPDEAMTLAKPFYENPTMGVKRLEAFIAAAPEAAKGAGITLDTAKVAAIGYCFGGSQALNLARSNAPVKAVVALHAGLASSLKHEGKITPKVLVLNGDADPMVKKEEVTAFKAEMAKAKADWKYIAYPGATHAFSNPKATELGKKFKMPIAYNKNADTKSWNEMSKFLKANLSK